MTTAREGLLDAFEGMLIDEGERSTTLDAVAARAQVSKGGLLYHFASKSALVDGLLERLHERADLDVAEMEAAPEGAAAHYVTTSAEVGTPFDRTFLAVFRLSLSADPRATESIQRIRTRWLELIEDEVGDKDVSLAVLLMGDGLYYNASLTAETGTSGGAAGTVRPGGTAGAGAPGGFPDVGALLRTLELLRSSVRD